MRCFKVRCRFYESTDETSYDDKYFYVVGKDIADVVTFMTKSYDVRSIQDIGRGLTTSTIVEVS